MAAKKDIKFTITVDEKGAIKSIDKFEDKVKSTTTSSANSFKKLAGVIGAAGVGAALTKLVKDTIDYGDKLHKLNLRLGVTVGELDKLHKVAKLGGVSFNTLAMGMQRMVRRVSEAAQGTGEAVNALDELGISAARLSQLKPEEQFKILAERLMAVSNDGDRARLAMKLFDSEGVALLQMMPDLNEELSKMTSNFNQERVDQMAEFNDSMTTLKDNIQDAVVPAITKLTEALNDLFDRMNRTRLQILQDELDELEFGGDLADEGFSSMYTKRDELRVKYLRQQIALLKARNAIEFGSMNVDPFSDRALINDKSKVNSTRLKKGEKNSKSGSNKIKLAGINDINPVDDSLYNEVMRKWDSMLRLKESFTDRSMELSLTEKDYDTYLLSKRADEFKELVRLKMVTQEQFDEWYKKELDKIWVVEEEMSDELKQLYDEIGSTFKDTFKDMIKDTDNFEDHFINMLDRLSDALFDFALKQAALSGIEAIGDNKGIWATAGKAILGAFAANGAVWEGGFQAFASGGTVSKPTLGLIGEGKYNEAIVPLPDGKSIPVQMTNGGGTVVNNINITNSAPYSEDNNKKLASEIQRQIQVSVKKTMSDEMKPGGIYHKFKSRNI